MNRAARRSEVTKRLPAPAQEMKDGIRVGPCGQRGEPFRSLVRVEGELYYHYTKGYRRVK